MPQDTTGTAEGIEIMRMLAGAWVARIINVAAELALADAIGEGAQSPDAIAAATETHPPSIARLLRALAAVGVLHEHSNNHYSLTPLGMVLRSDHPRSVRAWARVIMSDETVRPWKEMRYSLRTGQNAFEHVFGRDPWSYRANHPEYSALFNEAMQALTEGPNALVSAHYPFGEFNTIVDIGGGNGALLITILSKYSNVRGIIFELPHVASAARAHLESAGLSDRCEVVAGNAIGTIPPAADAYILKHVIHGRPDAEAVEILRNCRLAMLAQGKIILVERILPERIEHGDNTIQRAFLADINMLVAAGGKERTEKEYVDLLTHAGLRLSRILSTPSPLSLIEAE
jgi:hypothetical protein